jgi:UMF1 family MFS transporter
MLKDKKIWAWALYDWANSVFATVVIAGFFPIVFKQYWSAGISSDESTFWLGAANSTSSLVIVLLAPLLGAIADYAGMRKRMLLVFMLVGVLATLMLYPAQQGMWRWVWFLYVLGTIGFMAANIFYDALLINVGRGYHLDRVSGLGFGMGYLGGGLLLAGCVYMTQQAEQLGFAGTIDAVLFAFVLVALWWLLFSIPLAVWVDESVALRKQPQWRIKDILNETWNTLRQVFRNPQIRLFLVAYWIYIDGVDTIIRMAVDYGLALGFESGDLIMALLITQFVGFPAAIIYAHIGDRVGVKKALLVGISIYALITVWGYFMDSALEFYLLAVMIGLVQGGVQALSRSFYARLIPAERAAEYFGVYNMMGKAAAVLGPLLMGAVAVLTNNHRYSILSIIVFFIIGFIVLSYVKDPSRQRGV